MAKTTTVKGNTKSSVNSVKKNPVVTKQKEEKPIAPPAPKPAPPIVVPPQYKKMAEQLVTYFKTEDVPPADYVSVVEGSVKPVDEKYHLYKALVHTTVYIAGGKEHFSNIRFKTDANLNVIASTITFS